MAQKGRGDPRIGQISFLFPRREPRAIRFNGGSVAEDVLIAANREPLQKRIKESGCAKAARKLAAPESSRDRDGPHVWNAFRRNGAGRDALPLDPRRHVRCSCTVYRL